MIAYASTPELVIIGVMLILVSTAMMVAVATGKNKR